MEPATYSVCETIENYGHKYYTVVPSSWTSKGVPGKGWSNEIVLGEAGDDLMKYSDKKTTAVRSLLNNAKRDPRTLADDKLLGKWRCTIIYNNFIDYKTADDAAQALEMASSESDTELIQKKCPRKNVETDLFMQILSSPNLYNKSATSSPQLQSNQQQHNSFDTTATQKVQPDAHQKPEQQTVKEIIDTSMVIVSTNELNLILSNIRLQEQNINNLALNQEEIKSQLRDMTEILKKLNDNTSRLNAKTDVIAAANSTVISVFETPLSHPIENEQQLNQLESDAANKEFVNNVVSKFGVIFGKSVGGGGTVALQLIYKIFTKEFLINCSWTGGTRSAGCAKIAFKNHPHVIDLFFKIVQFCDPGYTYTNTVQFLQNRIKNAVQNQLSKNIRTSAERPNRKKKDLIIINTDLNVDDNENINIIDYPVENEAVTKEVV